VRAVLDHLDLVKERVGGGFLLDLLVHIPMHHDRRRVIVLRGSEVDDLVDALADMPLVIEHRLDCRRWRVPLFLRPVERHELDRAAAFREVVKELHSVPELLLGLDPHPVRETVEVVGSEICRDREVEIERKELGVARRYVSRPKPPNSITLPDGTPFPAGDHS